MELQLIEEHMRLERIVGVRQQSEGGGVGYLCKWKGLPYSEATWENKDFVMQMDVADKIEDYQVMHICPKDLRLPFSSVLKHIDTTQKPIPLANTTFVCCAGSR